MDPGVRDADDMNGQERIESMYAFIALDTDGTEGIPAFELPDGMALPMVGADPLRVAQLRPIAERISKDMEIPITLAHFERRVDIDVCTDGKWKEEK